MQGAEFPVASGSGRERVYTELIDSYDGNDIVMRSMVRDGYLVTAYAPTNRYAGTEGELYSLDDDSHQWRNLWDEPGFAAIRKELVSDLRTHLPEGRSEPLAKVAPV